MATRDIELVSSLDVIIPNGTSVFGYDVSKIWLQWEGAYLTQIANTVNNTDSPAKLITNGCNVSESTTLDCAKACRDITTMFETPATLWNCVTLATLSVLTRKNHHIDNGTQNINKAHAIEANRILNFGDLNNFDFPFANYRPCALESCILFGGCEADIIQFLTTQINNSRIDELASIMSAYYCTSAQPGIDSDIAGPGIIIAYFIQFGLVLFFAVSYTIIADWMIIPAPKIDLSEEGASKPGFSRVIKASIIDLQETQASFLVTIASAAIATFLGKKGTGLENIRTVASWFTNDTAMKGLVTAGSYPLLLIQLALHAGGIRGWYTLLFVIANGILVYVLHLSKSMDPGSLLPHFQDAARDLTSCGKHAGPRTFCRKALADASSQSSNKQQNYLFEVNSGVPYPVYALSAILVLDWAAHTIYHKRQSIYAPLKLAVAPFKHATVIASDLLGHQYNFQSSIQRVRYTMKAAYRGFWAFLELATAGLCVLAVIEAKLFWNLLIRDSDGDLSITKWPFGQLIAVAVWFPLVLKFLSLLIQDIYFPPGVLDSSRVPEMASWRNIRNYVEVLAARAKSFSRPNGRDEENSDTEMALLRNNAA